jgi:hypothetical protein
VRPDRLARDRTRRTHDRHQRLGSGATIVLSGSLGHEGSLARRCGRSRPRRLCQRRVTITLAGGWWRSRRVRAALGALGWESRGRAAPGRSGARGGERFGLVGCPIDQAVQIAGALLILAAYTAAQFGMLDQNSRLYLVLNLAGSAILAVLAWYEEQLGFLLLEGVWALVSAWSLLQLLRGHQPAAPHQ